MGYSENLGGIQLRRWWLKVSTSWSYSNLKSIQKLTMPVFLTLTILVLIILWYNGYFNLYKNKPQSSLHSKGKEPDPSCFCNGENFCFPGIDGDGTTKYGRKFDCSFYEGLQVNNLLDKDAANTPKDFDRLSDTWRPVFVTAISENHFSESRKLIASIYQTYPTSKIIVFDLGIKSQKYIKELTKWCNVEYRQLSYNKYPVHVKHLMNYAFKLVIIEALQDYKTFFYVDASVRIKHRNLFYFLHGVKNNQLLPFSTHTLVLHSVFSTTHQKMFDYLPLPLTISQIYEIQSTFMFVSDSPYTRYIMKWWYLCAMTKECIAPEMSIVSCNLDNFYDNRRTFNNCHRFDQAYWNIAALAYLFGEKRGALELGYVDKNWTHLTDNLVAQVEEARLSSMQPFFSTVNIKRNDRMKKPLIMKCPK